MLVCIVTITASNGVKKTTDPEKLCTDPGWLREATEARIEALQADVALLREALVRIVDGDFPEDVDCAEAQVHVMYNIARSALSGKGE